MAGSKDTFFKPEKLSPQANLPLVGGPKDGSRPAARPRQPGRTEGAPHGTPSCG